MADGLQVRAGNILQRAQRLPAEARAPHRRGLQRGIGNPQRRALVLLPRDTILQGIVRRGGAAAVGGRAPGMITIDRLPGVGPPGRRQIGDDLRMCIAAGVVIRERRVGQRAGGVGAAVNVKRLVVLVRARPLIPEIAAGRMLNVVRVDDRPVVVMELEVQSGGREDAHGGRP